MILLQLETVIFTKPKNTSFTFFHAARSTWTRKARGKSLNEWVLISGYRFGGGDIHSCYVCTGGWI